MQDKSLVMLSYSIVGLFWECARIDVIPPPRRERLQNIWVKLACKALSHTNLTQPPLVLAVGIERQNLVIEFEQRLGLGSGLSTFFRRKKKEILKVNNLINMHFKVTIESTFWRAQPSSSSSSSRAFLRRAAHLRNKRWVVEWSLYEKELYMPYLSSTCGSF